MGNAEQVAVPSSERVPLMVGVVVRVFNPDSAIVRLKNVVAAVPLITCAVPFRLTIEFAAVKE